jgi:hypothetical protein
MTSAAHVGFVRGVVDTDHIIKVAPTETTRSHGPCNTCSLPVRLKQSKLNPFNYSLSLIWGEITTSVAPAHFDVWEQRAKKHICKKKSEKTTKRLENIALIRHSPNIMTYNKRRIKLAEHLVRMIRGTNAHKIFNPPKKTDGNTTLRHARHE